MKPFHGMTARWYSAVLTKPQLWVEGEQAITGCDKTLHERAGIGCVNDASDVDPIPLKRCVGFVSGEQKLVSIADLGEGAAGNLLAGVPVVEAIAHDHLTETQEAGEARIDHSEEQHVVVNARFVKGVGDRAQMGHREGCFACGGTPMVTMCALQRAFN